MLLWGLQVLRWWRAVLTGWERIRELTRWHDTSCPPTSRRRGTTGPRASYGCLAVGSTRCMSTPSHTVDPDMSAQTLHSAHLYISNTRRRGTTGPRASYGCLAVGSTRCMSTPSHTVDPDTSTQNFSYLAELHNGHLRYSISNVLV